MRLRGRPPVVRPARRRRQPPRRLVRRPRARPAGHVCDPTAQLSRVRRHVDRAHPARCRRGADQHQPPWRPARPSAPHRRVRGGGHDGASGRHASTRSPPPCRRCAPWSPSTTRPSAAMDSPAIASPTSSPRPARRPRRGERVRPGRGAVHLRHDRTVEGCAAVAPRQHGARRDRHRPDGVPGAVRCCSTSSRCTTPTPATTPC